MMDQQEADEDREAGARAPARAGTVVFGDEAQQLEREFVAIRRRLCNRMRDWRVALAADWRVRPLGKWLWRQALRQAMMTAIRLQGAAWAGFVLIVTSACTNELQARMDWALQQWREAVVPEEPGREIVKYAYIKAPKSPYVVWNSMERFLLEKLVGGMRLRDAVRKLRNAYGDYLVSVPTPGVLRIEWITHWDVGLESTVVEKVYGSEEALARESKTLRATVDRVRSDMDDLGRHLLSGKAVPEDRQLRDLWNVPYRWLRTRSGIAVRSAGVDTDWNTPDDIVIEVVPDDVSSSERGEGAGRPR